ncbi:jg11639 [Pararge aegeria aegeria]|uniref:Jg11639 protein n=1 Tax=Pararge aegeria aegeria TaxID=348720 RepID=A0A8S4RPD7_9NEOP|nr:jg11639 [Pararge aegeria aegeria]
MQSPARYRSVTAEQVVHRAPTVPLAVGGVESSDRAVDSKNARGPAALRRRFDALLATPLRAHSPRRDNAALSHVVRRDIEFIHRGWLSYLTLYVSSLDIKKLTWRWLCVSSR